MQDLGIIGVSLHSYRYGWAERALANGYPERFAQAALGHKSRAVHHTYAKKGEAVCPSLEDYEGKIVSFRPKRSQFANQEILAPSLPTNDQQRMSPRLSLPSPGPRRSPRASFDAACRRLPSLPISPRLMLKLEVPLTHFKIPPALVLRVRDGDFLKTAPFQ